MTVKPGQFPASVGIPDPQAVVVASEDEQALLVGDREMGEVAIPPGSTL
jgi:hypothetical protein